MKVVLSSAFNNPDCNCTILYSDNPKDKSNATVRIAEPNYSGTKNTPSSRERETLSWSVTSTKGA